MKSMPVNEVTLKEVSVLASINSKYVVKYMDSFIEDNQLYLIMEHCENGDIHNYLLNQVRIPLIESKIWKIAIEILIGLADLHKDGIIHRDIKSRNVFLTRKYDVRIGDFGICACTSSNSMLDHKNLGTILCISPEICKGEFYSTKTDIWSLGCILYEMCTFKSPFEAHTLQTIRFKILNHNPNPIPNIYTKELATLIDMCLTKDADNRPTAVELLANPCNLHIIIRYKKNCE